MNAAAARSTLEYSDMPELYQATDRASGRGQRSTIRTTGFELGLLLFAAAAGAFTWKVGDAGVDTAALVGGAALVLTALLRVHLLTSRPENAWFDGRAAAESIKTLAWRYAMGGEPFQKDDRSTQDVDRLFLERLTEILQSLNNMHLDTEGTGEQITPAMRALRDAPLEERKKVYEADRIEDQRKWYAAKARFNDRRARRWNVLMLALESVGAVSAFLKAGGVADIAVLGIAGAGVAAIGSWVQLKQHATLASAYSVAAQELSAIKPMISWTETEEAWATFVAQSEGAVSREHTMWRGNRT